MIESPNRTEIVIAIDETVDQKMDNPIVVRTHPERGVFVLSDIDLYGHWRNSNVEVYRNDDKSKFLRFIEHFSDVTPRCKPSVLVYDYEIDQTEAILLIGPKDDISSLASKRLEQLQEDSSPLPSDEDDEMRYSPSKSHLQRVLDSVQSMRILIES